MRVSFLSVGATGQLLANPSDDFPLDFPRDTIERVYAHVRGQPYLTQLVGHTLVRLYNQSVFEERTPREPRFTPADVDEVVSRSEFYEQGSYYFRGVWTQAESGPAGQLALLHALAASDEPQMAEALFAHAKLDEATGRAALQVLVQHDVVTMTETSKVASAETFEVLYDFAVPLMRRWVSNPAQPEGKPSG